VPAAKPDLPVPPLPESRLMILPKGNSSPIMIFDYYKGISYKNQ
jgi:hypothetical protein